MDKFDKQMKDITNRIDKLEKNVQQRLDGFEKRVEKLLGPKQASPTAVRRFDAMWHKENPPRIVEGTISLDWVSPPIVGRVIIDDNGSPLIRFDVVLSQENADRVRSLIKEMNVQALRLSVVEP